MVLIKKMIEKDLINLIPENLIEASKLAEKILGINKKNWIKNFRKK